jgi:hypothetical protein
MKRCGWGGVGWGGVGWGGDARAGLDLVGGCGYKHGHGGV